MILDKPLGSWSFSRIETFDRCPYKLFLRQTKAPLPPENPDAPNVRGNRVHHAIENFITGQNAVLENIGHKIMATIRDLRAAYRQGTVMVEEDWVLDINWRPVQKFDPARWVWIKVDACHKTTDSITVHDWKSGRSEGNEIKHRAQGQLYAIATWQLFPGYKHYDVVFHYTDEDRSKATRFAPPLLERAKSTWETRGHKVASATRLPPNPLPHNCRYCDYGKTVGSNACEFASE